MTAQTKLLIINAELPSVMSGAFLRRDLNTYDAVVVVAPGADLAAIGSLLLDCVPQQQEEQDAEACPPH